MDAQNKEIVLQAVQPINPIYKQAIASTLVRPLKVTVPYVPNTGEKQFIEGVLQVWEVAAHWYIKLEWDSRYKIPFKQPIVRATKEHGLYLKALFRLCEVCHSRQQAVLGDKALPYANAAEWFRDIYKELLKAAVIEIYHPSPIEPPKNQKKAYLKELRDFLEEIREGNITLDPKVMPAFGMLLWLGSLLAENPSPFNREYFQPFLRSWSAMITKMDSPEFKRHWVEDGKLYVQMGQGRGKKCLTI